MFLSVKCTQALGKEYKGRVSRGLSSAFDTVRKKTPRRKIMVTSSLNEISTDQLANRV
jgi:hypothetical protein